MADIDPSNIYSLIAATSIALNDLDKNLSKKRLYGQLRTLQELSIGLISTEEISKLLLGGLRVVSGEIEEDNKIELSFSFPEEDIIHGGKEPLTMML